MDYMQELLRRQETLLNRLLLGNPAEESGTAEAQSRTGADAALQNETEAVRGRKRERTTEPMTSGGKPALETEETEGRAAPKRVWDAAEQQTLEEAVQIQAQAENFRRFRQADALWRGEAAPVTVLAAGGEMGSGAALEPEELSRAIQRDSRRYDGGFTMY